LNHLFEVPVGFVVCLFEGLAKFGVSRAKGCNMPFQRGDFRPQVLRFGQRRVRILGQASGLEYGQGGRQRHDRNPRWCGTATRHDLAP
jgi:hypothetical protein